MGKSREHATDPGLIVWSDRPIITVTRDGAAAIQEAVDTLRGGGTIYIDRQDFTVDQTIYLSSGIRLCGRGLEKTVIRLAPNSGCHIFTNSDHDGGNANLFLSDLTINGDMDHQERPRDVNTLTYCCGLYLKRVRNVVVKRVAVRNIRQTGLHFNGCAGIRIIDYSSDRAGWSGVSTSGTDDIAINGNIRDAGLDVLHSGIHLDGGHGAYFQGEVVSVTGNGVMLDSKYRDFRFCRIQANVSGCKRGVSLSGDHNNELSHVQISGKFSHNRETGIMVSNASHAWISDAQIVNNPDFGVLFQGKSGGNFSTVFNCYFEDNGIDISEIHNSKMNYFYGNKFKQRPRIQRSRRQPGTNDYPTKSQNQPTSVGNGPPPPSPRTTREFMAVSYHSECTVCGTVSDFCRDDYAIRETFRCQKCKASLRHRCQAEAILEWHENSSDAIAHLVHLESFRALRIFEPGLVGPFRRFFSSLPHYQVSYFWEDHPRGQEVNGVRNEDLMNLTFRDASFDLIITSDIMEHVRRPWEAFREIQRVLKPGGVHIFSIPVLDPLPERTVYRVDTSGPEDIPILPPHYHISGTGEKSLVYTDFGKDLIDRLEEEIGVDVILHRTHRDEPKELKRVITFIMKKKSL